MTYKNLKKWIENEVEKYEGKFMDAEERGDEEGMHRADEKVEAGRELLEALENFKNN